MSGGRVPKTPGPVSILVKYANREGIDALIPHPVEPAWIVKTEARGFGDHS